MQNYKLLCLVMCERPPLRGTPLHTCLVATISWISLFRFVLRCALFIVFCFFFLLKVKLVVLIFVTQIPAKMGSFDNIFQELEQTVEQEMTVSYWDNSDQNEIIQHYFADSFAMDSITTSPLPCDYDIANELIFLTNNPYDIEMDSYAEINGYTNNFDLNFVPHEQKKNQILDSLQIKLMALNDFDNCNNIDIVSFKNDQKTNIENLILTTEHNIEISCPIIMPASSMSTQTNLQTQTTITNEEIKLKRRREHNRIASRKCREKKLERIEFLESREQNLTNEIRSLEADVEKLLARKTQLRVALINYFGAVFDGNKPDPQSLLMLFDQARFKQLSNMH